MPNNMYAGAVFINDIIVNVLKLSITSNRYKNLGVECERTVFYTVVYRKTKYINDTCAIALKNLILEEINDNPEKKNAVYSYLKKHLSKDVKELIEKAPGDINKIIDLSISKFTFPDSNVKEKYERKPKVDPIIKKVEELYIKTSKYLNSEREIAFSYLQRTVIEILKYIIEQKNINIKLNEKPISENGTALDKKTTKLISYKNIVPSSIICIIDNLNNMLSISDSTDSYNYIIESIYFNTKKLVEWFIKDYLDDDLQFTLTNHKAEVEFYHNKEEDKIKIWNVDELLMKGWTYKEIAEKLNNLFRKYVPIRDDNNTSIDVMISWMKHLPEARKVILDNNNNVIGFWHLFPLFDDMFEKSKDGATTSDDITTDQIPLFIEGRYKVEFGSVVLEQEYRKTRVFKMLLYSILEYFEKLAIYDNVFIDEIVTTSSAKDGKALIKSIGLKFHKKNIDGTCDVYWGKVVDLLDKPYFRNFTMLKSLYEKEYNLK